MIRKWTTVVSWKNDGTTILSLDIQTTCNGYVRCNKIVKTYSAKKLKNTKYYLIKIYSKQALTAGQRIEIGIAETTLLKLAFFAYIVPLIGLFSVSGFFHLVINSEIAAISGALIGSIIGLRLSKYFASMLMRSISFQPEILNITLPANVVYSKLKSVYEDNFNIIR